MVLIWHFFFFDHYTYLCNSVKESTVRLENDVLQKQIDESTSKKFDYFFQLFIF